MLKADVVLYLLNKLKNEYPTASEEEHFIAIEGFTQYMEMVKQADGSEVKMWSQSVDFVWHQFILNTKEYSNFCQDYFGVFLHHNPSVSEVGDWKKDLELREWFMLTMSEMGYDPFYGVELWKKNKPHTYLPAILLADVILKPEGWIVAGELSILCYEDFKEKESNKFWRMFNINSYNAYQKFLGKFNPKSYEAVAQKNKNSRIRDLLMEIPSIREQNKLKGNHSEQVDFNPLLGILANDDDSWQSPAKDDYSAQTTYKETVKHKTHDDISSHSSSHKSGGTDYSSSHRSHSDHSSSYSHSSGHSSHSCGSSSSHSSHSCSSSSCSSSSCGGGF